jgi:hypothetical protein
MSDESDIQVHNFVLELLAKTQKGTLRWAADGDSQYSLAGTSGRVIVSSARPKGEHPYSFLVVNPEGNVIERVDTAPGEWYTEAEQAIAQLYDDARSSALDLDGLLDSMRSEWGL